MTHPQILQLDPQTLTIHPLAAGIPELADDDDQYLSIVEDIRERGIDVPLHVDAEGRIADGRHRWRAAKRLQLPRVPAVRIAESEVASVILQTILQRRHYTKGALAYLAFPLVKPAFCEAMARRLGNLQQNRQNPNVPPNSVQQNTEKNRVTFAAEVGIYKDAFYQAERLHILFEESDTALAKWRAEHPGTSPEDADDAPSDLRARFEPALLAGDIGLGRILEGIGGMRATKGQPKRTADGVRLFRRVFVDLRNRLPIWGKFSDEQRAECRGEIRTTVAGMPQDLRKEFASALRAVDKEGK